MTIILDMDRPGRRAPRQTKRGSRPNAGIEAMYRRKLNALVSEMNDSVLYWIASAYRNNPPEMTQDGLEDPRKIDAASRHIDMDNRGDDMAGGVREMGNTLGGQDERHHGNRGLDSVDSDFVPVDSAVPGSVLAFDRRTPADLLKEAFDVLARRWLKRFDDTAIHLARWFAHSTQTRSDATLRDVLRRGGFSVRFQMTPAMRDIVDATVHENVALIKSIPSQYLTQVEGAVMRSVTAGRDIASLTKDLREQFGVTRRRAKFIALDQNNKATAAFTRSRQVEHGLKAIWVHSHAGKTPRPTHLANDGKIYDPAKGWYDPAERKRIWPGTLIRCRCFSRSVVPGFE